MCTTEPTITVITIAYNEERLMPFFLNYYSKFCDHIVVYDNHSTDNTEEICKSFTDCKVTVIKYDTNNSLDDETYLKIKNNVYKDYTTDYCIVVDLDEFLYHSNIKEFLNSNRDIKVFKPQGYNMVSTTFPEGKDITIIKTGAPEINYCKLCLFKTNSISKIDYKMGCHAGDFYDHNGTIISPLYDPTLKLLHYKNLSFDYRLSRHELYFNRMSEANRRSGFAVHYTFPKDQQLQEFNHLLSQATTVI